MMDWYGGHMGGGGWALMVFVMVVVAAALIVGVLTLLRRRDASPPGAPGAGFTPERVLAERFARGEIEEAEYAGRLGALREQRRS